MSELPNGWTRVALEELIDILDSYRVPLNLEEREKRIRDKSLEELYPYYGATGQVGYIDDFLFDESLVLLGEDGVQFFDPLRPKAYQVEGRCWVNNHAHVLRARMGIADSRYILAFLNSFDYTGYVSGSTRLKLTQASMRLIPILLAPLNEQKRIADKLDALLTRVGACRERLQRVPLILKSFRQALLAAAMSGNLTEDWRTTNPSQAEGKSVADKLRATHEAAGGHKIGNAAQPTEDVHDLAADMFPRGWELLQLREIVQPDRPITYGILKPGPELETGVPYIRVADFPNNRLNLSNVRKTSKAIDQEFARSRLVSGDILLSIRGTVGRLVVIPAELEGANITQDSARLSIQPYVNRDYVLWYLRSDIAQARMKKAEKGVAVRGINIGDVRALQVAVPSIEEQNEIVRRIEVFFKYADRLEARYNAARARVEQLTPALLTKAFRGELVPQDPKDETASALLERVRAGRATAQGAEEVTRIKRRTNLAKNRKPESPCASVKDVGPSPAGSTG